MTDGRDLTEPVFQGGVQSSLQLSYLPWRSQLQAGVTCGFPMCMPVQLHAALLNGQQVSALVAVLDDMGEDQGKPRAPKELSRRSRRGHGVRPTALLEPAVLCTEAGSREACRALGDAAATRAYAAAVGCRLGSLMSNGHGARFITALVQRLPYGRKASSDGAVDRFFLELTEALPRAAMNAVGRGVYQALLVQIEAEEAPPSRTTRKFMERLCQHLVVLLQCSQAAQVLMQACRLGVMKKPLELSITGSVGEICRTPQGCLFLIYCLEDWRSADVAMGVLESPECFKSLAGDAKWSRILVLASDFGRTHRVQLAERVRRASLEEQECCSPEVKAAALWR